MSHFVFRLFDKLDDALEASTELHRLGIHSRDVKIFTTETPTEFETARFAAPHAGIDGNRIDDPLWSRPERISDNDTKAFVETLCDAGVSEPQALRLANAVQQGQTLIGARSEMSSVDVAATFDQFQPVQSTSPTRDIRGGGWESIPDDEFHSPAADERPESTVKGGRNE